jgi:hypothetical protein
MDCREFREKHLAFVDDTLPGIELVGMQMHLTECDGCSRQDAIVRRSLMLFRNLPAVQLSPDFSVRLQQRLHEAKMADQAAAHSGRTRKLAAAAAGITSVVMLGYIGMSLRHVDYPQDIVFPPVVATAIEPGLAMSSPAPEMVASVPAGLPIWTAALFAEQAPVHFASIDLTTSAR